MSEPAIQVTHHDAGQVTIEAHLTWTTIRARCSVDDLKAVTESVHYLMREARTRKTPAPK